MTTSLPEGFEAYLAARDNERLTAAGKMWEAMTEHEQQLVKDAAVMGYVRGFFHGRSVGAGATDDDKIPHDRDLVIEVLTCVRDMPDLYPALCALEHSERSVPERPRRNLLQRLDDARYALAARVDNWFASRN